MTLRIDNLRIEMGDRVLLKDTSFDIADGEKVALVGRNGQGKTTLLKTLVGENRPTNGSAHLPDDWAWLPQDTSTPPDQLGTLAFDYLLAASRLSELKAQLDLAHAKLEDKSLSPDELDKAVHIYSDLQHEFAHRGGYELESTAERIAAGVGLTQDNLLEEIKSLSGGQRRRLELARMLLRGGSLMILDEPTNHLDAEAKAFVMGFLRNATSTVLIVSHDISLMNESIDRVFALDSGELEIYKGTYSKYLMLKDEREEAKRRVVTNAQREVARLEKTKEIFRRSDETSSHKRKQLEGRIEKIKEQHLSLPAVKKRKISIKFPEPVRTGDIVVQAIGVSKSFESTRVFNNLNFVVERGEAFVIIGHNGAGKTTLLRCINGIYNVDEGEIKIGANVQLGFYAQEHEDIPPGVTVLQLMEEASGHRATESELRSMLGHFGLVGKVARQEAFTLSGGEKTKLSLARLVAGKANVLLLDEPTNNLDVESREALAAALQNYKGTIVLVSHDLDFVTQLSPERAIIMPAGKILPFDEEMLELVPDRG